MTDQSEFSVQELMVMHQSLLLSKEHMEAHSHAIIKDNGTDVYDSLLASVVTAARKIEALVATAKAAQEEKTHEE